MRAVVTGGAGFIGSNLVDRLVERGDEVVVVDDLSTGRREHVNADATFVERDIRRGLELGQADVVFHLAAQADVQTSFSRPDHDAAVNVVGTVQVLEAARQTGAQVVFASTGGAIYGECDGPAREDGPLEPRPP
jgi:UDP-glucose 4-epimerase